MMHLNHLKNKVGKILALDFFLLFFIFSILVLLKWNSEVKMILMKSLTFSSGSSSLSSKSSCCRHHSYSTWTWALNFPASAWFNCAHKQIWPTLLEEVKRLQAWAECKPCKLTSSSHCRCLSLRAISSGVSPASLAARGNKKTYNRCCIHMSHNTVSFHCVIKQFPTLNLPPSSL